MQFGKVWNLLKGELVFLETRKKEDRISLFRNPKERGPNQSFQKPERKKKSMVALFFTDIERRFRKKEEKKEKIRKLRKKERK